MKPIRVRAAALIAAGFLFLAPMTGMAQQDAAGALQQVLEAQFPPAGTTPDGLDLSSSGTIVVLQKDNFKTVTAALNQAIQIGGQAIPYAPTSNAYVDGAIKESGVFGILNRGILKLPGAQLAQNNHIFNSGEKLWVTKIQSKTDGVTFTLMSDPVDGVRYFGNLKFPYGKRASPAPDQVLALVSEVLRNDAPPAAQTSADAAPAQTKSISPGQTKTQVEAMFGPPPKTFKNGTKETYFYPDMKVTFVNNKVTDIQ
jgi:hypothetical protein